MWLVVILGIVAVATGRRLASLNKARRLKPEDQPGHAAEDSAQIQSLPRLVAEEGQGAPHVGGLRGSSPGLTELKILRKRSGNR